MKKEELKSGMLVQVRNDNVFIVIGDNLVTMDGYLKLYDYAEDLRIDYWYGTESTAWDIMKVSNVLSGSNLRFKCYNKHTLNANLLWTRPGVETIEILGKKYDKFEVEEMFKQLKEVK